jgi:hypothetical protein
MIVKLAFKKKCDGIMGRLIKWFTKSNYCHAEILIPGKDGKFEPGVWFSANAKKGVRMKPIIHPLNTTDWDYIDVEVPDENYEKVLKKANELLEYKYATKDLFLVQVFKLDKLESRKRLFCSEAVCEILKAFEEPKITHLNKACVNYSPGDLYELYL